MKKQKDFSSDARGAKDETHQSAKPIGIPKEVADKVRKELERMREHIHYLHWLINPDCPPDYKFELGTPAILEEDGEAVSGEIVLRDGVKCLSLYRDSNYAGDKERIWIPRDWNNVRHFGSGS